MGLRSPATESETYYFAIDLREGPESVVGVSIARNDEQNYVDSYEGTFSSSIIEKIDLSGQEGFVVTLVRNGFGIQTIKYASSFWWYKGEFEDGSPNGYGITCDNKHGEQRAHYINGSVVNQQSR